MRPSRESATALGAVLVFFLFVLPIMVGCDAMVVLSLGAVLGAGALACFAVAGSTARPRGSAWLGALLGAGLYLLPGVLLVSLYLSVFGGSSQDVLWNLRLILLWPSIPVAVFCGGN